MKHVLFLSYDGMTDPLGQSQVIPYLSGLTRFGYRFTILSCDKPDKYAADKNYVESLVAPFPIKWISIAYHKSPPVLSSVYDYFLLRKKAVEIYRNDPFEMIHTRPGLPPLIALWFKKKYGTKFLNDIRGFWADERVDGGMWNLKNPLYKMVYRFFRSNEDDCIKYADHLVCLTYAAEKVIRSWKHLSVKEDGITVIPCSADLQLFNPDCIDNNLKEQFKQQVAIKNRDIIFTYLGSIGGWYLVDEMMRFCRKISDKLPNARFLFISPHRHEIILNEAVKVGLPPEKLIITKASRHEVPVWLSFSDYAVFFIKPCYSKISSSPTKHGEIMSMGIPVITNDGVGDVAEIVRKYHAGLIVDDFSENSFSATADMIVESPSFNKEQIRKGAAEFYSLDNAVARYRLVYDKILN